MNKVTKNQIQLILLLLIVIIAFSAYRFGYVEYNEKAAKLKEENKSLQLDVAQLEIKSFREEEFTTGIQDCEQQVQTIIKKYGAGNTPQKSILFIRDLERKSGMKVGTMSFNPDTCFYTTNLPSAGSNLSFYTTPLILTYETSYQGLKGAMEFINNYSERMNVNNFTAVYNQETAGISGTISLNLYSVVSESVQYKDPVVSDIEIGNENIFRSN